MINFLADLYTRFVIKPVVSSSFGKKASPNALTLVDLLFAIIFFITYISGYHVVGTLFLLINGFLDTIDGSVARARGMDSIHGSFLDNLCDIITEALIFLALYFYSPTQRGTFVIIGLSALFLARAITHLIAGAKKSQGNTRIHYVPAFMNRTAGFLILLIILFFPSTFRILFPILTAQLFLLSIYKALLFLIRPEKA